MAELGGHPVRNGPVPYRHCMLQKKEGCHPAKKRNCRHRRLEKWRSSDRGGVGTSNISVPEITIECRAALMLGIIEGLRKFQTCLKTRNGRVWRTIPNIHLQHL